MSERKTTEIKLRVSPDEKTSWQLAAEKEEIGLSEFARRAMNDRAAQQEKWAEQNRSMDSTALIDNAIAALRERRAGNSSAVAMLESYAVNGDVPPEDEDSPVAQAVPTSGEVDCVMFESPRVVNSEEDPKPWTFEARKSD